MSPPAVQSGLPVLAGDLLVRTVRVAEAETAGPAIRQDSKQGREDGEDRGPEGVHVSQQASRAGTQKAGGVPTPQSTVSPGTARPLLPPGRGSPSLPLGSSGRRLRVLAVESSCSSPTSPSDDSPDPSFRKVRIRSGSSPGGVNKSNVTDAFLLKRWE